MLLSGISVQTFQSNLLSSSSYYISATFFCNC